MDKALQRVFKAKVSSTEEIAKGVKKIAFKLEEAFAYYNWQYVWVELLTMQEPDPKGSRRAFSIINSKTTNNTIEIVARISKSGYKRELFDLTVGESVIIHGPFGHSFVVDETITKNIVMIAGGVGIAAFMSQLEVIRDKKIPIKVFLAYINREQQSTPFLEDLKKLDSTLKNFSHLVKYEHFSFNDVKNIREKFGLDTAWWIAGTQGFVDQVYSELEKNGVARSDMEFENFYPTPKYNLLSVQVLAQLKEDNIFSKVIINSNNHTIVTDARGIVLYANAAAQKITGYTEEEMLGETPRLWGGMMGRDFYKDFWRTVIAKQSFRGDLINRRKSGDLYYVVAHITPIFDNSHNLVGFLGHEEDVTDYKNREEELTQLNRLMVGRELEMIKLKEEIKQLKSGKK